MCCQPEVTACRAVAQHALCVRIVHAWISPQVVTSSLGPLLRFGTGALASGYKAEFVPDDASSSGTYTLATVGGRRIKETSAVRQHLSVTQQGSAGPGYRGCWLGGRGGCTIVSIPLSMREGDIWVVAPAAGLQPSCRVEQLVAGGVCPTPAKGGGSGIVCGRGWRGKGCATRRTAWQALEVASMYNCSYLAASVQGLA